MSQPELQKLFREWMDTQGGNLLIRYADLVHRANPQFISSK